MALIPSLSNAECGLCVLVRLCDKCRKICSLYVYFTGALAAHIEELPGRKVHLTSIVKQNEGCMYIGVAKKLFDTLSLRILLPSALMRGNLIRFAFSL